MKKFIIMLFCMNSAFCSLSVFNDSAFPLTVKVIAANGVHIAEKEVPAHFQTYIEDQLGISDPVGEGPGHAEFKNQTDSMTPYQVYWYCSDGSLYSSCMNAGAGATVTANTCEGGSRSCPACCK